MIDKHIEELLEYRNDHILNILTEGLVDQIVPGWVYYGVFRTIKNYDSPNEVDIVEYYGNRDPERAEKRAKNRAAEMNEDRYADQKKYMRYSAKKLSAKFMKSDEFEVFFNKKRFTDLKKGIEEDARYAEKDLGIDEHELKSMFSQMVREHKLTAEDLDYWDWKSLKILDEDSSESISASSRTSVWSTVYNVAITLNGKEYTSRYVSIGDASRI